MCSPGARSIVTSCWPPWEFVTLINESGTVNVCVVASSLVRVIVSHRETDRVLGSNEKLTCLSVATDAPPSGQALDSALALVAGAVVWLSFPPPPPHAAATSPSASTPAAAAHLHLFAMSPLLSTRTRTRTRVIQPLEVRPGAHFGLRVRRPLARRLSDPGATVSADELAEGSDRGDRARRAVGACRAQRGLQGPGATGGAPPAAHGVPARPGPHRELEGLPPAQAQDPGVPGAGGRPLPGPADAHPGGGPDRPYRRAGPGPERGPHGGHRARPRPGAHAVRPPRRGGPVTVPGPALPPQRTAPAGRRPPGGRRTRPQPDLGGPRRHREPHLDHAHPGHAGGSGGPVRRPDRLREPRHRRRHPGRGPRRRGAPAGTGGRPGAHPRRTGGPAGDGPRGGQRRPHRDQAVGSGGRGPGRAPLVHVRARLPPGRRRGRAAEGGRGDPGAVRVLPRPSRGDPRGVPSGSGGHADPHRRLHRGDDGPVRPPHVRAALPSPGLAPLGGFRERCASRPLARFRDEDIQAVRERTDLVKVVGQYLTLKKAGHDSMVGLCPFHPEKTPSFSVSPSKQVYYCFGCGEGGDAVKFLTRVESLTFPEAIERLAHDAGIQLRLEAESPADRRAASRRQSLHRANAEAAGLYHRLLMDGKEGAEARQYLSSRGIDRAAAEEFEIGYSPMYSDFLLRRLSSNFSPEILVEAGLASKDGSGTVRDRFRGRITFPIHDLAGQAVAFGARLLAGEGAKYVNSAESPVYRKGRVL